MTNAEPQGRSGAAEPIYEIGFKRQIAIATTSFWDSPVRNRILLVSAALLTIILLTAYGQILLNRWNAPFYNSLERRDLPEFVVQLKNFAFIAGFLLLLNVVQTWLNQTAALYMRERFVARYCRPMADRPASVSAFAFSPLWRHPDTAA
jgi:ABC-type uncharacterized transport system, permease and ATPase components, COG4178